MSSTVKALLAVVGGAILLLLLFAVLTGGTTGGVMRGMGSMMSGGMMGGDMTDAMFLRMMIPHHQVAIDMSELALEEADHPELKELAQKIIDEQSAEIELMQGYLEEIESSSRR